ncbi:MAG: gamma-glutamylcyclotransferase [Bdellovibrionales bacterium]|nr:gamma-glutamylcyclotransferase [Bdellovibrionales bacterium]
MKSEKFVFAYGSLIWNPGFEFVESEKAYAIDFSRSLCIQAKVHRGTPDLPGLVLGLEPNMGSRYEGVLYRVKDSNWEVTAEYLRNREMHRDVYIESMIRVEKADGSIVSALAYIVNVDSVEYDPSRSLEDVVRMVAFAKGISGSSFDYLENVVNFLKREKIDSIELEKILESARQLKDND